MKKFTSIIMMLLIILTTCGCGQAKATTMPEKMLEWEIEDYIQQHEEHAGKYIDYDYDILHTPDGETNTDTIDIELTITYPYVTSFSRFHGVYQHNKKDDNWSFLRGSKWETPSIVNYSFPTSLAEWHQTVVESGGVAISVTPYEELQEKIYYILYRGWPELVDEIVDSWHMSFLWGYNNEQQGCIIYREDYGDETTAQQAFQAFYTLYKQQYAIETISLDKEANCSWYLFTTLHNETEVQMLVLQAGQDVFLFSSDNASALEDLLANIGFSITP